MASARILRGLILDMDGVLANTEPLQARAWVDVLARYGRKLEVPYFDRWIGVPNLETARDLVERLGLAVTPESLIEEREPVYRELSASNLAPFPGVREWLSRQLGLPKAVATSGHRAEVERTLRVLSLERSFEVVVTAEDVRNTKPDPEAYLLAARKLGLDPRECAVVEDSPSGIGAGVAAGCYVLAVTTTLSADSLRRAHGIYPSTMEALGEIERLRGAGDRATRA